MKAVFILLAALLFCWWMLRREEDPGIIVNAIAALGAAAGFILICLMVFHICG